MNITAVKARFGLNMDSYYKVKSINRAVRLALNEFNHRFKSDATMLTIKTINEKNTVYEVEFKHSGYTGYDMFYQDRHIPARTEKGYIYIV